MLNEREYDSIKFKKKKKKVNKLPLEKALEEAKGRVV